MPLKLFPSLRATASKGTAYSPSGPRGREVGAGALGEGGGSESWGREYGLSGRGSTAGAGVGAGAEGAAGAGGVCGPGGGTLFWAEMASSRAKKISLPCRVSNSKLPSPETHRRPASKEKVTWVAGGGETIG